MSDESHDVTGCDEQPCFLSTDRRRFLRDSFLGVAGALVALGMSKRTALAAPLELTAATQASGTTRTYPIPAADGAQVDRDNDLIIARWQGSVYAFSLACPHQNTVLKWDDHDHVYNCPKHHSKFHADGVYEPGSGRATRNMDRFDISKNGTSITVDLDKLYQQDTDAAQWAAAVVKI